MQELGSDLSLIKTSNPKTIRMKGNPKRKTSIIVSINGKRKYYHGLAARFFLKEFEKKTDNQNINPNNQLKRA